MSNLTFLLDNARQVEILSVFHSHVLTVVDAVDATDYFSCLLSQLSGESPDACAFLDGLLLGMIPTRSEFRNAVPDEYEDRVELLDDLYPEFVDHVRRERGWFVSDKIYEEGLIELAQAATELTDIEFLWCRSNVVCLEWIRSLGRWEVHAGTPYLLYESFPGSVCDSDPHQMLEVSDKVEVCEVCGFLRISYAASPYYVMS
jgi:hypothetical protein